jgi:AAA15 family ATPase/GTPase
MLIDFTVSNFRSIHAPVTLSLVATERGKSRALGEKRKRKLPTDEEIGYTVPMGEDALLTVAGIFGANASGKSNVIKALQYLRDRLNEINVGVPQSFRLHSGTAQEPSRFQLRVFDQEAQRIFIYRLGLGASVEEEELENEAIDGSDKKVLFRRGSKESSWEIGQDLEVVRPILLSLAKDTVALHLLIKQLDLPVLAELKMVLSGFFCVDGFGGDGPGRVTCKFFQEPDERPAIINLVQKFDTGIKDIQVEHTEDHRKFRVSTFHGESDALIPWDIQEDSNGTRALFELASLLIITLRFGFRLILDEFGAFLHPHITQTIVALFQNRETNPHGAQLIFNSHDLHLQEEHRMRRDQIWYTERRADGSTDLYPLSAFHPRNDDAIARKYGAGRYGAIPVLPGQLKDLISK